MKDDDDWDIMLETVNALFCSLADGIARRTGMTEKAAHEEAWTLFEQGYFKLVNEGDDASLGVEPCYSHIARHAAIKQNRRLADYRRRVIEEAVAAA
jgi:hypothetical protein